MAITLYQGANQKNPTSFETAFFDIDGATQGTDYSIQHTSTQSVTGIGTVHYMRVSIGASGIPFLDGIDGDSSGNIIPANQIAGDEPPYTLQVDAVAETAGVQPADWGSAWWWKYYTKDTPGDYVFYTGLTSDTWSNLTQYYSSTQIARCFYTGMGACFTIGQAYTYNGISAQVAYNPFGIGASLSSVADRQVGWMKYPGIGGSLICFESIGMPWMQESLAVGAVPKYILKFVEFDYSDTHYIGLLCVEVAADDTRVSAQIVAFSDNLFGSVEPARKNWGARSGVNIGRNGSFDNSWDEIDFPDKPTALNIANFGHGMHMHALTGPQVDSVFSSLWSSHFWGLRNNYVYNPITAVVSLHKLPLYGVSYSSSTEKLTIAGADMGISPAVVSDRIVDVAGFTADLPEYYGSYLDYDGTSAAIVLPFCGEYPLDLTDCMGGQIVVRYRFDLATGDCIAMVKCTNRNGDTALRKCYAGNAAWRIPVSGNDGGGAGLLSALSQIASGGVAIASGNVAAGALGIAGGVFTGLTAQHHTTCPAVQGNAAGLGNLSVYLKINRPVQLLPEQYDHTHGHSAPIGGTVGETSDGYKITGFAQYASVDLSGLTTADREEIEEIEALLKEGVWL